jgi:excisionase family DNA binding protein
MPAIDPVGTVEMSGLHITVELSDDQLAEIAARVAEMLKTTNEPAADPWLNTGQAAEHLGCPIGRIHDLVQLRKLTPRRDGRKLKFKRSTLDAYLEEQ